MIVLPQKAALSLIEEFNDDTKSDAALAKAMKMVESGEAMLAANIDLQGRVGETLTSESLEEVRYPTEFDPPQLPADVPKDKIAEVLKSWPVVGITPVTFETRDTGAMLEVNATVVSGGTWIEASVVAQQVRLLRMDEFEAGKLPTGDHLTIKQPQFATAKSVLKTFVRSGQWMLAGVHKLPGAENKLELFLLRLSVKKAGDVK